MTTEPVAWEHAKLALSLLAIDPSGLGGLCISARSGPVRDRFIGALGPALEPRTLRRLHPNIDDDQLFGGLDLTATLDSGHAVYSKGILHLSEQVLVLAMAERCPKALSAKIAAGMDMPDDNCLIALDEGVDDESCPENLLDRMAFHLDLEGLQQGSCPEVSFDQDRIDAARAVLARIKNPKEFARQTTEAALSFGVTSLRAPSFVLRAARALAALQRQLVVTDSHLATAAALVLGPRATQLPSEDDAPMPETAEPETGESPKDREQSQTLPEDLVLEAIRSNLPPNILANLGNGAKKTSSSGSGSGAARKGNRRGRPKPSKRGRLGSAARIDLIATLRAAAPWQKMRQAAKFAPPHRVLIRGDDIRLKNFEEKSDRLLIFLVDASGSAAIARLSEAKGAVELLLAEAYARRDHVALIAFRGTEAELLLPPTRSLVQTKKRLSALPGGGGTPLAKGLEAAHLLALKTSSKGLTPTIALLTDGRANIALDGSADRIQAGQDAQALARVIRGKQTPTIVIDTGMRPQRDLEGLARELDATYLPLPRADAQRVSQAIEAVLE